jgi:methyl-accepting chemotaxis protein
MAASIAAITARIQAQDAIRSEEIARATAARLCTAVRGVFEGAFDVVNATHDSLLALKDDGITDPRVYDTNLKRMIESGTDRFGAWLVWDGADAPQDTSPDARARRDSANRFATYWHQNGIEMLRDVVPADIYDSDLYRVPRAQDQAYLLEPHAIDAVAGDTTLVTSFSKPLEHDGRIVGVLAVDVKLAAITEALAAITLPEGATITVVSDGGIVAMSTIPGRTGKPLKSVSPDLAKLFERARQGDGSELSSDGSSRILTSWLKVRFAGVKNPWYLLMKVPERSLLASTSNDAVFLFLVCTLALLTILGMVLLAMNRLVSTPLKSLSNIINSLGEGLFDIVVPERQRMDEVGDIARAVQKLQDSGLEIARLQEESGENEFKRELARRAELDGISAHFSQSIEALVRKLDGVASTVEIQSREVSKTIQASSERLGNVSVASGVARGSMASVATATTSLLATIRSIGDQTRQNTAAAEKVEQHTASTDISIGKLKNTIDDIDRVAGLIREVASQINLIALNATIEAARAGEAGRGFAVVAHEIKTLATQTAKATEEIGNHISAVQKASGIADGSVSEMKGSFVEMREISAGIAGALAIQLDATSAIDGLVKQALGGADGVAQDVSELVGSSNQIQGAAEVMLAQSGELGREIASLSREVANFLQFLKAA